ncbi:hypothetical protein KIH77_04725 [Bifidobacterium sp. 82T24]|uniref:hypothetical protein n=1 Tax=Bifidobacterium pluvialisilvae TaxID=2834436 RepID=UPI001C599E02|nr:hypothetical protein [Bifidobacterium pluvialisilvae]MBW3088038.1 hypothetical protein [Bifidobacterium pluvialisilvae]
MTNPFTPNPPERPHSGVRDTHVPSASSGRRRPMPMIRRIAAMGVAVISTMAFTMVGTTTAQASDATGTGSSVLAPVDPQHWENQDDMTWDDYKPTPTDYTKVKAERDFHGAIVMLDFPDETFRITQKTPDAFGNPQLPAGSSPISRDEVPEYYRSLLNDPNNKLNKGETIDQYWKEQTGGKIGVNLEAYGPLRMPGKSYEYGLEYWMNGKESMADYCPAGSTCGRDPRTDAMALLKNSQQYKAKYGDTDPYKAFDEIFFVLAGEDESGTWQEFGEMKYKNKEDIPDSLGATDANGKRLYNAKGQPIPNWAPTRYVGWTSWKATARFWPNAEYAKFNADGSVASAGTVVLAEDSGAGTFAHEFSHVLNVADNYRNPFGTDASDGGPLRDTAGPFDILSRGSFNGPGGPHTRWDIPSLKGDVLPAGMAFRNRSKLGVLDSSSYVEVSRSDLKSKGVLVTDLQAREMQEKNENLGVNVQLDGGDRQSCSTEDKTNGWKCDGGGYDSYTMEVIDRMGTDSSQPDHGVMIGKAKKADNSPFIWTIDANPQDINMVDYVDPNGNKVMVTRGDQRQLNDALFHAGINSGSQYEYEDKDNGLHFYIANQHRDSRGVLHYTVAVRSTDGAGTQRRGVKVTAAGEPSKVSDGIYGQTVKITNTGASASDPRFDSDIYRVTTTVESADGSWKAQTPSAIVTAKAGQTIDVPVYAYRQNASAAAKGAPKVTVTVASESAPTAAKQAVSYTVDTNNGNEGTNGQQPGSGTTTPKPGTGGTTNANGSGSGNTASGNQSGKTTGTGKTTDANANASEQPSHMARTGATVASIAVVSLLMAGGALAILAAKRARGRG